MVAQQVKAYFADYSIRRETRLYIKTGRPIHAWRAYCWIRKAGRPTPTWFLDYLDSCAEHLHAGKLNKPEDVAQSFRLNPKGRKATTGSNQLCAVQQVLALKEMAPDASLESLFFEVAASMGRSDSYVRDAWYHWFPKKS